MCWCQPTGPAISGCDEFSLPLQGAVPLSAAFQQFSLPFRAPLDAVQGVAMEAVMPIFKAMVEAAEEIILRLHSESFGEGGQQGMTQASAYMQALTSHLTHCRSTYPSCHTLHARLLALHMSSCL